MPYILIALMLLAAVFGPGLWVRHVMRLYSEPADRYPGTGAEFVRHLAERLRLDGVTVEPTDDGDHYDPQTKTVRLTPANHDGRSLTAVTVAAHEMGHALQDAEGFGPLRARSRMVAMMGPAQRLGAGMLMAAPFVGFVTRALPVGLLFFLGGLLTLGGATLVHLVTLPVEFDASFSRALPILDKGGYLKPEDRPHARRILRAAAMTYVAGSLLSLLNVARWWAILRR